MFPFSFFILDSSLSLLASLSLPLPSDFDYRRSFRPRARCRALTHNTFSVSNLNTGRFSYTRPRALSPAGQHSLDLDFPFSPLPISYCVAQIVALSDSNRINTPRWPRRKAGKSAHRSPFVCMRFRATAALSPSRFVLVCVSSSRLLVRPDSSHRRSPLPSANPCVPPPRFQLTSPLDYRAASPAVERSRQWG